MVYDTKNPEHVKSARTRLEQLIRKGSIVELTEKKHRTPKQNAYLHLILGYFASQTGYTLEWVKRQYYKRLCNGELFVRETTDPYLGRTAYLRSTTELTEEELGTSISRFRNWAAETAGIYLPDAMDKAALAALSVEVERYKEYK